MTFLNFLLYFFLNFFYTFFLLFILFLYFFYFTFFYFFTFFTLFYFFTFLFTFCLLFYYFVLLSPTTPGHFLYLRETQANVLRGHMLSGGPNRELSANVILYCQGLQCWVGDLIGKNLCANKIFASNNLGGVGGVGVLTIQF